ncbi:hypothetical protein P775_06435 [Puniceibacterium antarcticum]|uniref:ABC transporter domain-containing protein n=1 Tax=Puniceibacterium antarcticum TaxID=1206336 RepID=A0A2G8RHK5_9RHOB|nr:ATP-binding cassette domain-containing protein [Puniceibacterium antarcticum]PIL21002.1 hypothetical protein P775_06435 [Puniceibacterium antarcticum]
MPAPENMELSVKGLIVTGAQRRKLLDLPCLTLAPGQSLGISGPSGAGKTTLLHAVAGLIPVNTGAIQWGDTDLADLSDAGRARFRAAHMGLVFQTAHLFDELSALDNAAIAAGFAPKHARAAIRDRAREHLQKLGVQASTGRAVATFSGGERQRISMSRALARSPAILLADEPTASLDRAAAERLGDDLLDFSRQGGTLIVVSHDPSVLARMDTVLRLADGQVMQ